MSSILKQTATSPQLVTPEMFAGQFAHTTAQEASFKAKASTPEGGSCPLTAANFVMPNLGVLDQFIANDAVNDILVNGTQSIYIDSQGRLTDSGVRFETDAETWDVAERIMASVGLFWVPERPIIDTRLPDGSRVNIVGPPIAVDGVSISIRKFPKQHVTLDRMAEGGQLSQELAVFLKECARMRVNIVIAGGTSTGKTTLLNALSAAIPEDERIVTVEDSAELRLQQPHVVRLESKPSRVTDEKNIPEVSTRDLIKNALRMRPDRIIVGESRGPEAFDVLQAMNTGHDGSMTTLHANSSRDALSRLETMVMSAMPTLTSRTVRQHITSALHLVIQITRQKDGKRSISHVTEVCGMEGDTVIMQDLVTYIPPTAKGPGEYRWAQGSPRNPMLIEAGRMAGFMKVLR
jgi:pilus assembly protein CpaF